MADPAMTACDLPSILDPFCALQASAADAAESLLKSMLFLMDDEPTALTG